MPIIDIVDLPAAIQSHELVNAMVDGANAKASRVAPCLSSTSPAPTEENLAEARLVLIGAVKRWAEAGSGAVQSQAAGIFSQTVDTRQRGGFNLWPSEIGALQDICRATSDTEGRAYEADMIPATSRFSPLYNGS